MTKMFREPGLKKHYDYLMFNHGRYKKLSIIIYHKTYFIPDFAMSTAGVINETASISSF